MSRKSTRTADGRQAEGRQTEAADDLLERLNDDHVIDTLVSRLYERLTPMFEKLFAKLADDFSRKYDVQVEKTAIEVATRVCDSMAQKIVNLEKTNASLETRLEEVTNLYRMDNLIIHDLPETSYLEIASGVTTSANLPPPSQSNQEALCSVIKLCNERLGVAVNETAFSSVYRIPRGKKDSHRLVIVRFTSQRVRSSILSARKILRSGTSGSGSERIYINEHLRSLIASFCDL